MSILHTVVNWSARYHRQYQIPKGFILVKYQLKYRKNVAKALQKLDAWQEDRIAKLEDPAQWETVLRDIDAPFDIHYMKRSPKANDLMWSLYEIEANELNVGHRSADMETPEHIYQLDMEHFAPKFGVSVKPEQLEMIKRQYSMVKVVSEKDGKKQAWVYITSSHWDSKQMHTHLKMIFDRLSEAGVSIEASADISKYWMDWRQNLNDEKYIMHDELYTIEEYRDLVKNCEACGCQLHLVDTSMSKRSREGSVAHIKAVGMGGHRESKYRGSQLMHLCDADHAQFDNGKGITAFLKNWPHLKYKVETGLKREYPQEV